MLIILARFETITAPDFSKVGRKPATKSVSTGRHSNSKVRIEGQESSDNAVHTKDSVGCQPHTGSTSLNLHLRSKYDVKDVKVDFWQEPTTQQMSLPFVAGSHIDQDLSQITPQPAPIPELGVCYEIGVASENIKNTSVKHLNSLNIHDGSMTAPELWSMPSPQSASLGVEQSQSTTCPALATQNHGGIALFSPFISGAKFTTPKSSARVQGHHDWHSTSNLVLPVWQSWTEAGHALFTNDLTDLLSEADRSCAGFEMDKYQHIVNPCTIASEPVFPFVSNYTGQR